MEWFNGVVEFTKGLGDYPRVVQALWIITFCLVWISIGAVIYTPKREPVDKWLLASDESTLKTFVPQGMRQDLEAKKQKENDLTRTLQNLSSGALLGKK